VGELEIAPKLEEVHPGAGNEAARSGETERAER
jgi:hypothetical protein